MLTLQKYDTIEGELNFVYGKNKEKKASVDVDYSPIGIGCTICFL